MKRRLQIALLGLLVGAPVAGHASILDTFGFGARGMAMGNAHTATSSDTSANYYNPAALTRGGDVGVDMGYLRTFTALRINDEDLGVDESHGSMIGLCVPGDIGGVRAALGLAFYMPDARVSRVRALPESQPRFALFDNRNQHVEIRANLAIRPFRELSIGVGMAFLTSTRGQVLIRGMLTTNPEEADLETEVDVTFETSRFPVAGILWEPSKEWSFGLTYRGESLVELDLNAQVQADIIGLLGSQALNGFMDVSSFNTNFFAPHQIFFGIGWNFFPGSLLAVDVGGLRWSRYPTPTARVSIDFQVDPLETSSLLPAPSAPIAPEFHDIFAIRLGLEHTVDWGTNVSGIFRGGYAFEPSPAPRQSGITNYVDTDKHLVTLGFGLGLFENPKGGERPLHLEFTGQGLLLEREETQKTNPGDPVGDYYAEGEIWTAMANARFVFPW